nr:DNA internalization-related competence protein ComEC/Rec2 [Pseudomonadales bacterium]
MIAGMLAGAAGIVIATRLPVLPGLLPIGGAALLASVLACWRRPLPRLTACLVLGLAWGCLRGHELLARALPAQLEGRDLPVRLCVEGLPLVRHDARGESWRLRARVLDPLPGASGPLARWQGRRVELGWYGPAAFAPGEAWAMTLRLRAPRGFANPGGYDYQAWLLGQGIDATGYAVNKAPLARLDDALCRAPLDHWRYRLRARLQGLLGDEPQLGKLLAVTLGDASRFTPADWALFARTGTTHLMVISGMHITLVAMLVMAFAGFVARAWPRALLVLPARSWGMLAAAPATLAYGALAGMGVSVQRALLMVGVLFLFGLRERQLQPWLAYALALLAVLVAQPLAAMQTGFWLSFITVGALLLAFAGRLGRPSRVQLLWLPQLVVGVALWCPLLLAGQAQAPLAPLVNALAIPLADLVVVPAALAGCLLLALGDAFAWPLLKLALLGLELLTWLLQRAAAITPELPALAPAPDAWRIAFALLGTVWLLLPRGFPARAAGVALMLPLVLPARDPPPLLELLMLDAGQGSAVVVRTARHSLVYDAGPRFSERFEAGGAIVAPALARSGVRRLDRLVISHADNDHSGGAAGLFAALPVDDALGAEGIEGLSSRSCERGMRWEWDGVAFAVLHPRAGLPGSDNNRSCVLRIAAAGRVLLLAGDIEAEAEALLLASARQQLRADILLVPHHGSHSSSTPAFVAAVQPRYALVSAGHRNRFGHPHPDVLARYRASGAEILETARHGAVRLQVDAHGVIAPPERWRIDHRRFWYAPEDAIPP